MRKFIIFNTLRTT